jgi:hypothetical protein
LRISEIREEGIGNDMVFGAEVVKALERIMVN